MRKNRLLQEIESVVDRNNRLYSKCNELENQLEEKDRQIAELKAASAEATAENELLKAELEALALELEHRSDVQDEGVTAFPVLEMSDLPIQFKDDAVTSESEAEDREETKTVEAAKSQGEKVSFGVAEVVPVTASTALIAEERIKDASRSIGRVVLKCAELCNEFAVAGDINSKDLINLALGRTEVFKSEVLQLATTEKDNLLLTSQLEAKEAEVFEYFDLLKNQI